MAEPRWRLTLADGSDVGEHVTQSNLGTVKKKVDVRTLKELKKIARQIKKIEKEINKIKNGQGILKMRICAKELGD